MIRRLGTDRTLLVHGAGVDELPLDGSRHGLRHHAGRRSSSRQRRSRGAGPPAATTTRAGRGRARRERGAGRGGAARRARGAAGRRAAQRRGGDARRGDGRDDGGGDRPRGADGRRRAGGRAAGGAPGGAGGRRGGGEAAGDGGEGDRGAGARHDGAHPCPVRRSPRGRRARDRRPSPGRRPPELDDLGVGGLLARSPPRRAAAHRRTPRRLPASTSSPRSSAVAVGGRASPACRRHRRPRPRLRGRWRFRDLRPVRAPLVRRVGGRPARGARGRPRAGPGQGVRRRSPGSSSSSGLPGPTSCCCWRCSTRRRRLARLVGRRSGLGLEPLVEAHDARELERRAGERRPADRAQQPRPADARRGPGAGRPAARARPGRSPRSSPKSGVRDTARPSPAGARPGSTRALVGEALMRAADPAAAARAFVAAGRDPGDPAADARVPFVKICGVTDAAGVLAAVRAGADAIGLNFVPGTPRALTIDEAVALARLARRDGSPAPAAHPDRGGHRGPAGGPAGDRRGRRGPRRGPAQRRRAPSRSSRRSIAPVWKAIHCRRSGARDAPRAGDVVSRGPDLPRRRCRAASSSTRPAGRIRAGPGSGSRRARRRGRARGAGHPRRWPRPGQRRRGAAVDPGGRRGRRVRRRSAPRARASARARTRSGSPCSSSAPGPPATTGPTSRSARRPSTPACSRRMPPVAGGWSGTSAGATSPRR